MSDRPRVRVALMLPIVCALLVGACATRSAPTIHKRSHLLMGTLVEISISGERESARKVQAAVAAEFKRVERLTSFHRESSELGRINAAAGGEGIKADPEILGLIRKALEFSKQTHGAFDPTIGPVARLWNFSAGDPRLPEKQEISRALVLVGWERPALDDAAGTIRLPDPGMALDLGAIAKGYALDRAAKVIRDSGIGSALINAGGDIIAVGEKLPGRPWRIGVQDPDKPGGVAAIVPLRDRAIVTSGDYERFFVREGKRFHHILDPRTGNPAHGLRSVTILAPDGITADALATAVFVLGPKAGLKLVDSTPKVECLLIDEAGQVIMSKAAGPLFEMKR